MDLRKLKTLIDLVAESGIAELEITEGEGKVRIVKSVPIFHEWRFTCGLEFDDSVIDTDSMKNIITHVARYGGFGDFRPTFGRATVEISE